MARLALAIRHVHFEDLGLLEPLLERRGFEIAYQEAWETDFDALPDPDLLIFLGGPIGVNDTALYPFLEKEFALAAKRIAAEKPLLGLCLGAQIICRGLGGTVERGAEKELGWAPVTLAAEAAGTPLTHLDGVRVLHWHQDICHPPQGVISLASTPACPTQAFRAGPSGLACQFHVEVPPVNLEAWLVGHTLDILLTEGVTVPQIREDTARYGHEVVGAGTRFFEAWLDEVGL